MNEPARHKTMGRDVTVLLLITLFALSLRWTYIHVADVDNPLRGDAARYVAYALNLVNEHVFSMALPGRELLQPDSFRDPGYPAFLAFLTLIAGDGTLHYGTVLDVQSVLSAITVTIFTVLARRWLGFVPSIIVGCIMALWPHLITAAGYLLSETFLGALIGVALLLSDIAIRKSRPAWFFGAGVAWALAALTNAVVLPFAPIVALAMMIRDRPRRALWLLFLAGAIAPTSAWQLRSAFLTQAETSSNRALMNLVQGAWPEYRYVYGDQAKGDPELTAIARSIETEYETVRDSPAKGIPTMAARLARQPLRSLIWYASKPAQLWGWDIGVGEGDIYVITTTNSPIQKQPLWRAATNFLFFLSPFLMLLAASGCALLIVRRHADKALRGAAYLAVYITIIYTILQADARYATPYRGIEILMAVYACREAMHWVSSKRPRKGEGHGKNASPYDLLRHISSSVRDAFTICRGRCLAERRSLCKISSAHGVSQRNLQAWHSPCLRYQELAGRLVRKMRGNRISLDCSALELRGHHNSPVS